MKNKEIEELLKMLKKEDDYWSEKKHDYPFPDYYSLNREDLHLLLSYIEQIEEELKYSIGIVKHNQIVTKLSNEKKQLQNNRDKAVREIMHMIEEGNITFFKGKKLENILMGDSK